MAWIHPFGPVIHTSMVLFCVGQQVRIGLADEGMGEVGDMME